MEINLKNIQAGFHQRLTLNRRIEVLSRELAKIIPDHASVLDVGAGSGEIASRILQQRPDITISGIDVVPRKDSAIPISYYDGLTIPYDNNSFDCVMCIDMLHHSDSIEHVLEEVKRVSKNVVVIKDHNCNSAIARKIISFTDGFANKPHGVPMTYNYLSRSQWLNLWDDLELDCLSYSDSFGLYPFYSYFIFARDQDFITLLKSANQDGR